MPFIEAREITLQKMLSPVNEAYKVPLYQRPYTWDEDQWEDLFEDITELKDDEKHFLGFIVVVPEGEHRLGVNYFQIIDGQQRLATLLIWLSAIRDIARENGNDELAKYLTDTYLFAKELEGNKEKRIPKLGLGKLDEEPFQKILEGNLRGVELVKNKHLIFKCYEYFRNRITDENLWQKLLNNILIVHVNTYNYFNAFRLFETLNDRGLELSAADLIKNFVLMKTSADEDIFSITINEWNEMYSKVRNYEPVKFIKRYILSNWKGKISEKKLYDIISLKLRDEKIENVCEFVKSLNSSATVYKKLIECSLSSEKLNRKLEELHLIEVGPSFTLLLKIVPYFENDQLSEEELFEIMEMIETFHIRWGICGLTTSKLDQIYNEICIELQNRRSEEFKKIISQRLYQEIIKNNIDDEIFKKSFALRNFKANERRTKYILWKLSEPTGETIFNINEIHVEHIMPKNLSSDWIDYLTKETCKREEEIIALHEENLNKIGNLTIIKGDWNKIISNKLFDKKKEEYKKSEFQITKTLTSYSKWTFDEIKNRTEELAEKALNQWRWKWK